MVLGIKAEGWLTIAAIILGPVLAFFIQHWRDVRREERTRQRQIFQQLLLTLKVPMAPRHVDALNSIPIEFRKSEVIMQSWREYIAHLNNRNSPAGWGERKFELLVTLVNEIAKSLGYDHLDKAALRTSIYVPQGYEDQETQIQQIRSTLLQVLKGERPIPMTMVGPVEIEAPLAAVPEITAPTTQPALPAHTTSGNGGQA